MSRGWGGVSVKGLMDVEDTRGAPRTHQGDLLIKTSIHLLRIYKWRIKNPTQHESITDAHNYLYLYFEEYLQAEAQTNKQKHLTEDVEKIKVLYVRYGEKVSYCKEDRGRLRYCTEDTGRRKYCTEDTEQIKVLCTKYAPLCALFNFQNKKDTMTNKRVLDYYI